MRHAQPFTRPDSSAIDEFRYGELSLGDLAPGEMRPLTPDELRAVLRMLPADRSTGRPAGRARLEPSGPQPPGEAEGVAAEGAETKGKRPRASSRSD